MARDMAIPTATPTTDTGCLEKAPSGRSAKPIADLPRNRLARKNVAFISNLMESGVEFRAVDFPQANRLTVHILAAVAEHEREMIATRTKAALAAAKARGTKLGGDRGNFTAVRDRGNPVSVAVRSARRTNGPLTSPTMSIQRPPTPSQSGLTLGRRQLKSQALVLKHPSVAALNGPAPLA